MKYLKFVIRTLQLLFPWFCNAKNTFYQYFTYNSTIYVKIDVKRLYDTINRYPDSSLQDKYKELQVFQEFVSKWVKREYVELEHSANLQLFRNVASYDESLKLRDRTRLEVNRINTDILNKRINRRNKRTKKRENKHGRPSLYRSSRKKTTGT